VPAGRAFEAARAGGRGLAARPLSLQARAPAPYSRGASGVLGKSFCSGLNGKPVRGSCGCEPSVRHCPRNGKRGGRGITPLCSRTWEGAASRVTSPNSQVRRPACSMRWRAVGEAGRDRPWPACRVPRHASGPNSPNAISTSMYVAWGDALGDVPCILLFNMLRRLPRAVPCS